VRPPGARTPRPVFHIGASMGRVVGGGQEGISETRRSGQTYSLAATDFSAPIAPFRPGGRWRDRLAIFDSSLGATRGEPQVRLPGGP